MCVCLSKESEIEGDREKERERVCVRERECVCVRERVLDEKSNLDCFVFESLPPSVSR